MKWTDEYIRQTFNLLDCFVGTMGGNYSAWVNDNDEIICIHDDDDEIVSVFDIKTEKYTFIEERTKKVMRAMGVE